MIHDSPLKATTDQEVPAQTMIQSDMMTRSMLIFESNGVEFQYKVELLTATVSSCRIDLCKS